MVTTICSPVTTVSPIRTVSNYDRVSDSPETVMLFQPTVCSGTTAIAPYPIHSFVKNPGISVVFFTLSFFFLFFFLFVGLFLQERLNFVRTIIGLTSQMFTKAQLC